MIEIFSQIILPMLTLTIIIQFSYIFVSKSIDHIAHNNRLKALLDADCLTEVRRVTQEGTNINNGNRYK